MTPETALVIFAAGAAAGWINTVVGSGTLITFPTLLALGYPPVVANVSNTLGLLPGSVSGAYGYRRELAGQRPRIRSFGLWAAMGGAVGAGLLLALPAGVFRAAIPILISIAIVLVAAQPLITRWLARRGVGMSPSSRVAKFLVFGAAVYGGYFGAAQSIIIFALLSTFVPDTPQRLNALKVVLAATVNAIAAVVFVGLAPVSWPVVVLIAIGSFLGGFAGAAFGRRLSPGALRIAMIAVAVVAIGRFLWS